MNEDIELELDCLIEYDSRTKKTKKYILKERYDKLQNNWNELKKWCKENQYIGKTITFENDVTYTEILEKMQELEQGKDG